MCTNGAEAALQSTYDDLKRLTRDRDAEVADMRVRASTLEINTKVYRTQMGDIRAAAETLGYVIVDEDLE